MDVYAETLKNGDSKFISMPGPEAITPKMKDSARTYAQLSNGVAVSLNLEEAPALKPINNRWRNKSIDAYNAAIDESTKAQVMSRAHDAASAAYAFINHHAASMKSLVSILEYDPFKDLSDNESEPLLLKIKAAGGGIERTSVQLSEQSAASDPTIADIQKLLKDIESKRAAYEMSIESGDLKGSTFQDFVTAVEDGQKTILSNRQEYWEDSYPPISEKLRSAYEALNTYRVKMNNL